MHSTSGYDVDCKTDVKYSLAIDNGISDHGSKNVKEIWEKKKCIWNNVKQNMEKIFEVT